MASQLSRVRWDGYGESQRFARSLPPSTITLPDGPPDHRRRRRQERDIADAAPPARVHRRQAIERHPSLEPCS